MPELGYNTDEFCSLNLVTLH